MRSREVCWHGPPGQENLYFGLPEIASGALSIGGGGGGGGWVGEFIMKPWSVSCMHACLSNSNGLRSYHESENNIDCYSSPMVFITYASIV